MLKKELNERLKELRQIGNLSQEEMAKILEITLQTYNRYEKGHRIPDAEILNRLVQSFGVNLNWLITGEGEMFIHKDTSPPQENAKEVLSLSNSEYIGEDYILIPMVDGAISAGNGLAPIEYSEIEIKLAFRKDWLQRKGDYRKMSLIRVEGDSMEPTLFSGDIVLVDGNKSYVDLNGGIYAIYVNDAIMIKRIQLLFNEKKLKIISDNSKYEPIVVSPDDIHVIGKIIWIGREIEK